MRRWRVKRLKSEDVPARLLADVLGAGKKVYDPFAAMRAIAAAKRRAHYEDERQRHGLY
jgi:hypothetical protein